MSAYGDVTCDLCGKSHHELVLHECDMDDVRTEFEKLKEDIAGCIKFIALQETKTLIEQLDEVGPNNVDRGALAKKAIARITELETNIKAHIYSAEGYEERIEQYEQALDACFKRMDCNDLPASLWTLHDEHLNRIGEE